MSMTLLLPHVVLAATSSSDGGSAAGGIIGGLCGFFFALLVSLPAIAGLWGVFTKAGKPGWAAIVPIYNAVVLLEIVGKPIWWIVLLLCPCISIIFSILVNLELAKCFGKGGGFAAGLILLPYVFLPILGFNKDRYTPPAQGGYAGEEDMPRRRRRRIEEDEDV
jgi:hypothetical protein